MCITKIEISNLPLPCHHCGQITAAEACVFDASQDLVFCAACAEQQRAQQPFSEASIAPTVHTTNSLTSSPYAEA